MRIDKAKAVGADQTHVVSAGDAHQLVPSRRAFVVGFREISGQDHATSDPGIAALGKRGGEPGRRYCEQRYVNRAGRVA